MEGFQVRKDPFDPTAQNEGHGINPVCSDVADRPQFAAFRSQKAPIVVGFMEQPVLEKVPLHMDDFSQITACDHGAHLKDGREEPAHVVDGKHRRIGFAHCRHDPSGFPGIHAQRFFTNHVFACLEGLERLRHMRFVGRGDVDDIDVR